MNEGSHDIGDENANAILEQLFGQLYSANAKLDDIIERLKNLEVRVSGVIEKREEHRRRGHQ